MEILDGIEERPDVEGFLEYGPAVQGRQRWRSRDCHQREAWEASLDPANRLAIGAAGNPQIHQRGEGTHRPEPLGVEHGRRGHRREAAHS
jgi:hypothetical protein